MRFVFIILVIFISACSQVKPKKTIDESQVSELTKSKLSEARDLIKENKLKQALAKLAELNDNTMIPIEKALKYNLKGVILFNMNETEKAILNFEVAEKYAEADSLLYSQVQLNMASGYFKLNQFSELSKRLERIDKKIISDSDQKKYAHLALAYGKSSENSRMIASSSLTLMGELKSFDQIQNSNLYEPLKDSYRKLTDAQKIELLEEFNATKNLAVAYMAQFEAKERYVSGDKAGAESVIDWLKSEFKENEEVRTFVKDFESRLENSTKMTLNHFGVILPLSGDKASFGQKALSAIQAGLKALNINEGVNVFQRDSMDRPDQGVKAVETLVKEENVSFIIGGLFPETARAEYLEAKKYGVLYISLSPINLPKEEKNHHLIEIQGSVESQAETLLSDEMIKKFGTRLGIIFPETEGGKAYADEIWRKATQKNVQITSIATFPKNIHDYRDTAQLFLGLKYQRERSEELNILDDVYSHEKSSIRRVQTLPPVLDFDWVFLATYPHEAIGLIPTLGYYDANRVKFVGGPSWVSNSLVKEQKNLGTLYFVGEDPKDINLEMLNKFQAIYGKPAGLIEILALDALKLGADAMSAASEASHREAFDLKIKENPLKGLTTTWSFNDGVWLKRMHSMAITRGEVVKLFSVDEVQ